MARRSKIYAGRTKTLFAGPEPGTLVQHFTDEAILPDSRDCVTISGKGVLNNLISEYLMSRLHEIGIPTHFVRRLNIREQVIRELEIIPVPVVVRNIAAGSLTRRLGIPEGTPLPRSIVEYCYKSAELGDPLVSEEHVTAFGWASPQDIDDVMAMALRINDFLIGLFAGTGIRLADFRLEFGRLYDENGELRIVVADEISPDTCRLREHRGNAPLGRDCLKDGPEAAAASYREIARRLGLVADGGMRVVQAGAED